MRIAIKTGLFLATALSMTAPANAAVTLIATATMDQNSLGLPSDLSGLDYLMENGVAANVLGGLGSGFTWTGGNTFIGLPDRGPNANPYNAGVDNTASWVSRFHELTMDLTANAGPGLAFTLTPTLNATTLLSSPTPLIYGDGSAFGLGTGAPAINDADSFYYSGRSDNFGMGNSGDPLNGRFDPEGIRMSNDGKYVFVTDEYGPYVRQFNRVTGELVRNIELPADYYATNLSPVGATEIANNTVGRFANRGMEGLAISPDGTTLIGMMQGHLKQDATNLLRIVTIDIATGAVTGQFGYNLTDGSGVSEIVAVNNTEFLVLERDGRGLGSGNTARVKKLYSINLAGATDITGLAPADAQAAGVTKTEFLDIVTALEANGIARADIPAKLEGLTFGQDVDIDGVSHHTLYIADDNDFLADVAGPSHFYVFSFTDDDLAGFVQQAIVPEPSTWAMLIAGFGLAGASLRRRQAVVVRCA